jgi:DNA-binding transcriptional ArsR family regulator
MKLIQPKAIRLAELFAALGDPSRVRLIALLLDAEMSVSDLAAGLEMTESAVSHQLRGLRHMQIVRARKSGRQVFYCLDDEHVARLFSLGLDHVRHG